MLLKFKIRTSLPHRTCINQKIRKNCLLKPCKYIHETSIVNFWVALKDLRYSKMTLQRVGLSENLNYNRGRQIWISLKNCFFVRLVSQAVVRVAVNELSVTCCCWLFNRILLDISCCGSSSNCWYLQVVKARWEVFGRVPVCLQQAGVQPQYCHGDSHAGLTPDHSSNNS